MPTDKSMQFNIHATVSSKQEVPNENEGQINVLYGPACIFRQKSILEGKNPKFALG